MNPMLANMIKSKTPPVDERVGLGIAHSESPNIPHFIDELFRVNSVGHPDGLKYLGFRALTPRECYREASSRTYSSNSNKRLYNVNRTDIRYYTYNFDYKGKQISKVIMLPFIRRHGFMFLNGVKYIVTPILADGTFTIKHDKIFFKTIKARIWFLQDTNNHMIVDGRPEPSVYLYSYIHYKSKDAKHMKPTLINYLCMKYGLSQTMRLLGFANNTWHAMTRDDFLANENSYPKEDWVVIEPNGKKPTTASFKSIHHYVPSKMLFVVKRDVWENNPLARSTFSALIYNLVHYTSEKRMAPELIDDIRAWHSILGEIISGVGTRNVSEMNDAVDRHIESLDTYVNAMAMKDLNRIGLGHLTDFYKVLIYILENFNELTSSVSQYSVSNSMFGKQLQVLNFMLSNITNNINVSYFKLSALKTDAGKNDSETMSRKVEQALNNVKTNAFMNRKGHSEFTIVDDPCDLPLLKMGRIIVQQEKSDSERTAKTQNNPNDPVNALHESLMQVGAALDMTKSDPTGRSRLNPWVHLADDLTIIPNPELADKMKKISDLLL